MIKLALLQLFSNLLVYLPRNSGSRSKTPVPEFIGNGTSGFGNDSIFVLGPIK